MTAVKDGLTAKRRKRVVENGDFTSFARRVIRALSRRVADGDVEALKDLAGLAGEVDQGLVAAVAGLRGHGYSWAEIGARLGVSKQAAQQRWG